MRIIQVSVLIALAAARSYRYIEPDMEVVTSFRPRGGVDQCYWKRRETDGQKMFKSMNAGAKWQDIRRSSCNSAEALPLYRSRPTTREAPESCDVGQSLVNLGCFPWDESIGAEAEAITIRNHATTFKQVESPGECELHCGNYKYFGMRRITSQEVSCWCTSAEEMMRLSKNKVFEDYSNCRTYDNCNDGNTSSEKYQLGHNGRTVLYQRQSATNLIALDMSGSMKFTTSIGGPNKCSPDFRRKWGKAVLKCILDRRGEQLTSIHRIGSRQRKYFGNPESRELYKAMTPEERQNTCLLKDEKDGACQEESSHRWTATSGTYMWEYLHDKLKIMPPEAVNDGTLEVLILSDGQDNKSKPFFQGNEGFINMVNELADNHMRPRFRIICLDGDCETYEKFANYTGGSFALFRCDQSDDILEATKNKFCGEATLATPTNCASTNGVTMNDGDSCNCSGEICSKAQYCNSAASSESKCSNTPNPSVCNETLRQNCVCGNKRVSCTGDQFCKIDSENDGSCVLDCVQPEDFSGMHIIATTETLTFKSFDVTLACAENYHRDHSDRLSATVCPTPGTPYTINGGACTPNDCASMNGVNMNVGDSCNCSGEICSKIARYCNSAAPSKSKCSNTPNPSDCASTNGVTMNDGDSCNCSGKICSKAQYCNSAASSESKCSNTPNPSVVATCGTLEEDCPDCENRDDERCITNGVDGICFQGKCAKSCQTFIFHGAAPEWEGNKDRKWDPILKMTNRVKVLENFACALVISSVGFRCCEIAGSAEECRSICPVTATSSREFDNCRENKNDRSSNKKSCDTRSPSNHTSAAKMCASQNMRLCRASEFQEEKCYFTGCNYDYDRVWVGQDICNETLRQNCVCGNKRVSCTGDEICKMDRGNHGSCVLVTCASHTCTGLGVVADVTKTDTVCTGDCDNDQCCKGAAVPTPAATLTDPDCRVLNPMEASRTYSSVYSCSLNLDLHNHRTSTLDSSLGWSAGSNETGVDQWMVLDLGSVMEVAGTVVQGRSFHGDYRDQHVTKYTVSYSSDNHTWAGIQPIFPGKVGNDSIQNFFPGKVKARYIRISPKQWAVYPTMRAGVIACSVPCEKLDMDCDQCGNNSMEHCNAGDGQGLCKGNKCVAAACLHLGGACDECIGAENSVCRVVGLTSGVCKSGKCAIRCTSDSPCLGADKCPASVSFGDVPRHCYFNDKMGECNNGVCLVTCRSSSHSCQKGTLANVMSQCDNNVCTDAICCKLLDDTTASPATAHDPAFASTEVSTSTTSSTTTTASPPAETAVSTPAATPTDPVSTSTTRTTTTTASPQAETAVSTPAATPTDPVSTSTTSSTTTIASPQAGSEEQKVTDNVPESGKQGGESGEVDVQNGDEGEGAKDDKNGGETAVSTPAATPTDPGQKATLAVFDCSKLSSHECDWSKFSNVTGDPTSTPFPTKKSKYYICANFDPDACYFIHKKSGQQLTFYRAASPSGSVDAGDQIKSVRLVGHQGECKVALQTDAIIYGENPVILACTIPSADAGGRRLSLQDAPEIKLEFTGNTDGVIIELQGSPSAAAAASREDELARSIPTWLLFVAAALLLLALLCLLCCCCRRTKNKDVPFAEDAMLRPSGAAGRTAMRPGHEGVVVEDSRIALE